jgi:cytochrome b6-f complex iron-sulfur subunit
MSDVNRRDFIVATAVAVGACVSCPLYGASAEAKKEPVDVGVVSDFPRDGIYDRWAAKRGFFVVRNAGRLYAVSATCTHKRYALVSDDGAMKCPKHGSIFNTSGKATKAPARKPLPRFSIRLDERGRVIVDRSRELGEDRWDEPGSYVRVK